MFCRHQQGCRIEWDFVVDIKNFNPAHEAEIVEKSWLSFKKWFEFFGGREVLKKQELQEKNLALSLSETKEISTVWKEKNKILDPETLMRLEECIYLTLLIEWGDDAKCFFDYEKNEITFKHDNKQITH